jgi:crotonobetainyl-CoA:carnitine CoA-transferase CaiB-like acyl-CoA transferase
MTADGPPDTAAVEPPLGDVVVVDLTRALAGPHAAMMLGDLGARVIKVESLHGDDSRTWGPPFVEVGGVRESTYFMSANRNKESIRLDLKDPGDLALLERLVARADVLLENFRVGVLDRLDLGPRRLHDLNPRLVIGSITGFGHDGPESDRAGYDQIAQGEGGLMSLTGETPTKIGVPIADLLAGMNLAYGVVAALHERHRTGRGRVVRTSLLASAVGVHAYLGTMWTVGGVRPTPTGVHHPSIAPYGMYRTRSEPVQIACASERLWLALAGLLGLDPSDPRFVTNLDRVTHRDELTAHIESALVVHPAEHWLARLDELGIPAGKVRAVDDVYAWEQTRSQGLLMEVTHPVLGTLPLPGSPIRLDDNAWSGGRREHLHPPMLGEHDDDVRAWLEQD